MPAIHVNGATLAYDERGKAGIPIVLIHGHPFDRSMWAPQIAYFGAADHRVIAPDLRGYGRSAHAGPIGRWQQFAEDTVALIDRLGIETVVLVGLSMGGQIAMEFSRLFPDRLRGLVLAATFPQAETDAGKQDRRIAADRLLREGMERYAVEALPRMLAEATISAMPSTAAHVLRMMRRAHPAGAAAALIARAERPDYQPVLAALDCPALVIAGDEDSFTTKSQAEAMRALLRHSELVWMPGVGHMPNLERPVEFNASLDRFVLSLSDGVSAGSSRVESEHLEDVLDALRVTSNNTSNSTNGCKCESSSQVRRE